MAIESVDGSNINGVSFDNIRFKNAGTAFFVLLGLRLGSSGPGSIGNISFNDITGVVRSNWGSAVSGTAANGQVRKIENVGFRNVHIAEESNQGLSSIPGAPPEYAGEYPDPRMPGWHPLPAYGIYFRHVEGMSWENSTMSKPDGGLADPRPGLQTADDVSDIH